MEDQEVINHINGIYIIGLFDGHGGDEISKTLPNILNGILNIVESYKLKIINREKLKKNIQKEFINIDKLILKKEFVRQGSTSLLLYILDKEVISINLGDSKTIFLNNTFQLEFENIQHRPNLLSEIDRIIYNKYTVTKYADIYRLNNELSLSRSFGDFKYKFINGVYNGIDSAVSVIPDIEFINTSDTKYIILATDGLWDYIDNDIIIKYIQNKNIKFIDLPKKIILEAIKRGSNDNISIIIIKNNAYTYKINYKKI